MVQAHVLLFIDTDHQQFGHFPVPTVVSAGIFGSRHVTSDLKRRYPVELFSAEGETYEDAVASVKKLLTTPEMFWVAKLMATP